MMSGHSRRSLDRRQLILASAATSLCFGSGAHANGRTDFQAQLHALGAWVQRRGGTMTALAQNCQDGRVLGAHQAQKSLNPASTMKLLTAALALDTLGSNYRYQTGLYGTFAESMSQLVLRGHGDPSLTEPAIWRLNNVVSNMGLKEVSTLLVDQAAFDAKFVPPAFEQQPDEWSSFRAPVSAIAVNRNSVTLNLLPTVQGEKARAWFEPQGAIAKVEGAIKTTARATQPRIGFSLKSSPRAHGLLAHLSGALPVGARRQRFTKRIDNPLLVPGLVLRALLQQRGIRVGKVTLGGTAVKRRITYHGSARLADLVKELGKRSDNFYAEMIFKSLSLVEPASTQAAAQRALNWAESLPGVSKTSAAGLQIVNGSGLFDANRLSAEVLVAVLKRAYQNPRIRNEFMAHLSIGGVDGTLRSRFPAYRRERRVRAKTGTLRDSIALSGYVAQAGAQAPVAFAVLVNGIAGRHQEVRRRIDEVVSSLLPKQ